MTPDNDKGYPVESFILVVSVGSIRLQSEHTSEHMARQYMEFMRRALPSETFDIYVRREIHQRMKP